MKNWNETLCVIASPYCGRQCGLHMKSHSTRTQMHTLRLVHEPQKSNCASKPQATTDKHAIIDYIL